jgi:hypothetical protein
MTQPIKYEMGGLLFIRCEIDEDQWEKPRIEWLKCNVDAAFFVDQDKQLWILVSVIAPVSLLLDLHNGSSWFYIN